MTDLMLTGRVPFEGTTQVQTLMAHLKQEVPDMVREDGVPVPVELQQVILKCLKKDAEERFGSMNDVIIGTLPFVATMFVMIALLVAFPELALWLPKLFY